MFCLHVPILSNIGQSTYPTRESILLLATQALLAKQALLAAQAVRDIWARSR